MTVQNEAKIYMSPTRAFKFARNPLRALEDYTGESKWFEGDDTALLYGTIVHNIAEGRDMFEGLSDGDRELLVSSRGKTKGQLKSSFKEAEIVGIHLRSFVSNIADNIQFEIPLEEANSILVDEREVQFNVTGRADMLTENAVYDFKTVASNDFQGFLEYGSFRDHREVNYVCQAAFYAHMFNKTDAHILYIQKNKDTPFIYDYQLTERDLYDGWVTISEFISDAVKVIDRGKERAKAVNDGSIWAFKHFGGVIDGNQNDKI